MSSDRIRLIKLVDNVRRRAARRGIEFDLNWRFMEVPSVCPLLGSPIGWEHPGRKFSPSIDRLDPTRGYTTDNVWIISNRANAIKNDATLEELKTLVANLEARLRDMDDRAKRT